MHWCRAWAGAVALAMVASGCGAQEDAGDGVQGPADGAPADAAPDGGAADAGGADAHVEPDAAPPPPACDAEDDLAPNQTADRAVAVELGFTREGLYLCRGTQDWFRVPLAAGQGLRVVLDAEPPETDLDLAVTDLAGTPLAASRGEAGRERVDFVAPAAGDYLVQVDGYAAEAGRYTLSILSGCRLDDHCPDGMACNLYEGLCEPFGPAACGRDAHEPNDLGGEAKAVGPGALEGTLCGADRDWFAVELEAGATLDVLASTEPGRDLDLVVVDAANGRVVGSATNDARVNPERVTVPHLPAGRYLVGLFLFAGEGDADYRLEVLGRSGRCAIDRDCGDALPVCDEGVCRAVDGGGAVPLGGRCGVDADCAPDAGTCSRGAAGGHDNFCTLECGVDADCVAVGPGAACVRSRGLSVCHPACRSDDDCGVTSTCRAGRCQRRAACERHADCGAGEICASTGFSLSCRLAPPPPQCGIDEGREPNESVAEATPIAPGTTLEDVRICDDDDDWYRLTVPEEAAAQVLAVRVAFRRGADLDVYLRDAAGNEVGVAASADRDEEVIEARFIAPGDYFILVDQYASDRLEDTRYTLSVELSPSEERCTVAGGECDGTAPLRIVCDEASGACRPLEGQGQVALGERCDSHDDCVAAADACWVYEGGGEGRNICTRTCQRDADCAQVPGTTCQPFPQLQVAACLPG